MNGSEKIALAQIRTGSWSWFYYFMRTPSWGVTVPAPRFIHCMQSLIFKL